MSETPTVVVEPTEVLQPVFAAHKPILLFALAGMCGALVYLLIEALKERDKYRAGYADLRREKDENFVASMNGKYHGPVSTPETSDAESEPPTADV